MARTNRIETAINFISNEILESRKLVEREASTMHFGKACGWQKYIEGLEKALSIIKTINEKSLV